MRPLFILLLVGLQCFSQVTGEFGDYVDPTWNCHAQTTCAQVCVVAVEDCPQAMSCEDNLTLCADGSCEENCPEDLESPCEFKCASVACPKVIDTYDNCKELYGPLYDAEAECGEVETVEETTLLHFNEPAYIVVYTWVAVVTALILLWCAYK